MYEFAPTPEAARLRLSYVSPMDYAQTRNALNGAVSLLSPYVTHGFLSVPDIALEMYQRHRLGVQHKFIQELGWREYFQHLHQHWGDGIAQSRHLGVLPDEDYAQELPEDVRYACTRVPVIDHAIRMLYTTGYLHNHARLWVASYLVHMRKVHWRVAADWMYSHLLDGDIASNYMSWQWVAGTHSDKPYLFNAESIEKFAPEGWFSRGTAIDASYETLAILAANHATMTQARRNELAWDEPLVLSEPPAELGFQVPRAEVVHGKQVWLVHPWQLADVPSDLAPNVVCIAVVWSDQYAAHPWDARRWHFVGERMAALTPHRWWGTAAEVAQALQGAEQVQAVVHARMPVSSLVPWRLRSAPRLFRHIDKPQPSFSQWWTQVTKGVGHLQQLIYPITPRSP